MKQSVNDRKHGRELVWESMGWSTNLFINVILANFSTNDSLGEALLVISKETVGNSWDISSAILGHKYHQNHSNRSSKWGQHLQQKWLIQSKWVSGSIVLLTSALRKPASYSEIRSRSNAWKEHTHTDYTHFLLQILGLFISYIY